jgi:hypothetical protein
MEWSAQFREYAPQQSDQLSAVPCGASHGEAALRRKSGRSLKIIEKSEQN